MYREIGNIEVGDNYAEKTYAKLKMKYFSLKALLNVAGVNLTDIDEIQG